MRNLYNSFNIINLLSKIVVYLIVDCSIKSKRAWNEEVVFKGLGTGYSGWRIAELSSIWKYLKESTKCL